MEFTKNFKAVWWFVLLLIIGFYLFGRLEQLQVGAPSWFDAIAFLVWVALGVGPFYGEIELPGLKLKQEVTKLKEHVSSEVASVKTAIRMNAEQQQVTNVNLPPSPPPDNKLEDIHQQIKRALAEVIGEHQLERSTPDSSVHRLSKWDERSVLAGSELMSSDTMALFHHRYNIEVRLREIYRQAYFEVSPRKEPVSRIVQALTRDGILPKLLAGPILELYSICSAAVHGEDLSAAKIDFVKKNAPSLVVALDEISKRPPEQNEITLV